MLDTTAFRVTGNDPPLVLANHDPDSRAGFEGGKMEGKQAIHGLREELSALQERLWAQSEQALLVILQAMDTGGKDGTIRHVFRGVNPQGVRVHGFGRPSPEELSHDYLWRIHRQAPEKGMITIFNRSHYEDVLVVRVHDLVPEARWSRRYRHIRDFERMLAEEGTRIVKVFLHISPDEQKERLQSRLDEPAKRWKFSRADLDERALWGEYQKAYQAAIAETAADHAPWYVVPANRKWYRNLVVSSILIQTLEDMGPRFPEPEESLDDLVVT